jgi:class 3 adenylate cyclase
VETGSAATFLFADIAGFTALTEAHGDKPAVQLVDDFAAIVQAELPNVGGEYVKTVGDALMLRVPDLGMRFASVYGSRGMRCAVIRRRRFDSAATSARLSNEEATTSARRSTLLPGFRHSREVAAPRHRQYSGARS